MYKAFLLLSIFLVGCENISTTHSKTTDVSPASESCSEYKNVNKVDSTGDFQACRFNNKDNLPLIEKCMSLQGWTKIDIECTNRNKLFYSRSDIESCFIASNIDGKIDFKLMNSCLSLYEKVYPVKVFVETSSKQPISNGQRTVRQTCSKLVNPNKNDPTADFQACSYNTKGDFDLTDACMKSHGWSRVSIDCVISDAMVYRSNDIDSCLKSSKINDMIDFDLMNSCLSHYEKKSIKR